MREPHLWEIDHPYYASTGNYYSRNDPCHEEYASWGDFAEQTYFHHGDRDQNLLYRWDWVSPRRPADDDTEPYNEDDYLALFFMLPRKAIACSVHVSVTDEDEPTVRAWLEECAATLAAWWQPLQLRVGGEGHD